MKTIPQTDALIQWLQHNDITQSTVNFSTKQKKIEGEFQPMLSKKILVVSVFPSEDTPFALDGHRTRGNLKFGTRKNHIKRSLE